MERSIIFKMESEGRTEEFRVLVNNDQWSEILSMLTEKKALDDVISWKILNDSSDEELVSNAVSNYEGRITNNFLLELLKRFPNSEAVQVGVITYCEMHKRKTPLRMLVNKGITDYIRELSNDVLTYN